MRFRFEYFMGETVSNLRRNLLMTLAGISTVAVSLFLLGGVMIVGEIVQNVVRSSESKLEVDIFLREEITPDQTKELGTLLASMPEVADVSFVSKEEAFAEFQEMFKETPSLTENVDKDALPASYRVKLRDPSKIDAVRTRVEGRPGVEEVNYGGDTVDRLLQINALLKIISAVMIFILGAAATLLIANTIRLGIFARRREIGIMKLVGATNWFIRVPFIFEGIAQAAFGAILATGVLLASKELVLDKLQAQIVFLPVTVGIDVILQVLAVLILVGMAIGALGSSLALRRFLEV